MGVTRSRAVFLDRDGTLIEDVGYPSRPEQVVLLPGAGEALRGLRDHGFALVVVSNQSGVGRGILNYAQADAVHKRFASLLAEHGVKLDAAYYCFHAPGDRCDCRKPAPGLILDAARELDAEPTLSFMIGNTAADIEAGRSAGCATIAMAPAETVDADWTVASWHEAYDIVLRQSGRV